jgi:hypothetical protein
LNLAGYGNFLLFFALCQEKIATEFMIGSPLIAIAGLEKEMNV